MTQDAVSELAPGGTLRAAINLSNFLLVTGTAPSGDPAGVAPDMAAAIAEKLGVALSYLTYPSPGALADAAGDGVWDIGLIAAEPARAETIAFTPAYVEIEASYMVPEGSPLAVLVVVGIDGLLRCWAGVVVEVDALRSPSARLSPTPDLTASALP